MKKVNQGGGGQMVVAAYAMEDASTTNDNPIGEETST